MNILKRKDIRKVIGISLVALIGLTVAIVISQQLINKHITDLLLARTGYSAVQTWQSTSEILTVSMVFIAVLMFLEIIFLTFSFGYPLYIKIISLLSVDDKAEDERTGLIGSFAVEPSVYGRELRKNEIIELKGKLKEGNASKELTNSVMNGTMCCECGKSMLDMIPENRASFAIKDIPNAPRICGKCLKVEAKV